MIINPLNNHRLLVIDDNRAIHEDIRKILINSPVYPHDLQEQEAALFLTSSVDFRIPLFEIDSAYQGQEGLDLIEKSLLEGRPYALAFVDVRMPPGWDGVETIERLWQVDPALAPRLPAKMPDLPAPVADTDLSPTQLQIAVSPDGMVQHAFVDPSWDNDGGSSRLDLDQQAILAARKIRFARTDQPGLVWGRVTVFWQDTAKPSEVVVPTPVTTP